MTTKTNLELADECDNFPYFDDLTTEKEYLGKYYDFKLQGCPVTLGYVPSEIANRFPLTADWRRDDGSRELVFQPHGGPSDFADGLDHRNEVLARYLQDLRDKGVFKVLAGWRNEQYPIYGPGRSLLLSMERSATPLFGVVTYGVHMTAYVKDAGGLKIWAPRRAETKQTYPGMMDNTVAGGLSTGEKPMDCLIREAMEEASLPEHVVTRAISCGTLTYHHLRGSDAGGELGLSQPECQYIYDLELPADVTPKPNDDEAVDFQLLTVAEVQDALAAGRFKPNCAHLLLEFFVRHGIVTAENEAHYIELVSRLHRRLGFPTV